MVDDNKSHRGYAYRRTGRRHGRLRWSGYGGIRTTKPPEEVAALFKGQPVSADIVRRILSMATAHLFVEMTPHHGGTGITACCRRKPNAPHAYRNPTTRARTSRTTTTICPRISAPAWYGFTARPPAHFERANLRQWPDYQYNLSASVPARLT
jgi:hypothetical protein